MSRFLLFAALAISTLAMPPSARAVAQAPAEQAEPDSWVVIFRCTVDEPGELDLFVRESGRSELVVEWREWLAPNEPMATYGRRFFVTYRAADGPRLALVAAAAGNPFAGMKRSSRPLFAQEDTAQDRGSDPWKVELRSPIKTHRFEVRAEGTAPDGDLLAPRTLALTDLEIGQRLVIGRELVNPRFVGAQVVDLNQDGADELAFAYVFAKHRGVVLLGRTSGGWQRTECPRFDSLAAAVESLRPPRH